MRKFIYLILGIMLGTSASAADFYIKSSAFQDKHIIPTLYTCNGKNISPPLSWGNAPADTKSFVLIFSAPLWITREIYLWILYNLPPDTKGLQEGTQYLPKGTVVNLNFYDEKNYRGPCPPNERLHEYVFTLYALDEMIFPTDDEMDPEKLIIDIKPHVLGEAKLTGYFSH